MSKGAKAVAVLLLAGGVAFLVERLIVTDKEAIIAAADRAAAALGRGDAAEAVKVLHPSAITDAGDPEATRRALEEQLRQTPLERLNFLVNDLTVENGTGIMTLDLIVHPADKKQGALFRLRLRLEWVRDGEEWKVRRAQIVR